MRIISGKYKGHHLVSFSADHIRPTTDRVKETMFNKIQFEIEGTQVIDLFSGTGSLGLEAISRGAEHVVFVEQNPKSIEILQKNIAKLKIEKNKYSIVKSDVIKFLKNKSSMKYNFIFIDPPFTEKMGDQVMQSVSKSNLYNSESLIFIESQKKEKMEDQYGHLSRVELKDYGDKILSIFKKETSESES